MRDSGKRKAKRADVRGARTRSEETKSRFQILRSSPLKQQNGGMTESWDY